MRVDMSSRAVTVRLKRVSQLRRLCLDLGKARPLPNQVGDSGQIEQAESRYSETDERSSTEAPGHRR